MLKQEEIDKYIESIKDDFLLWNNVLLKYENELSNYSKFDEKIKESFFIEVNSIFLKILTAFTKLSNIKDDWTISYCPNPLSGISAEIESKKTNTKYSFVFYNNEFFLETFLPNAKDLHKVSDNFWINLIKLNNYGAFSFEENTGLPFYNNINLETRYKSNSNIFRLVRNFIFLDLTEGALVDIGTIQVKWGRTISWADLIRNGSYAFELLYKVNKEIISRDNLKYYRFYEGI